MYVRFDIRCGSAGDVSTALAPRRAWMVAVLMALLLLGAFVSGCGGELGRAQGLDNEGDLAGAAAVYSTILEKDPDNLRALNGLAADLVLLQQWDQVLPVQERLVSLDKSDVRTRIELGFNYLNHQGRPADAARVLSEASVLDPTAQHLTFLAQAQIQSGEEERAEQTLRSAMEVDPRYAHSYRVLSNLLVANGRTTEAAEVEDLALLHGVAIETTP